MDALVEAGLRKWPNVPACYGWLALDARGDWYLRDDRTQAAGPFPQSKGSRVTHDKLRGFIERNYGTDAGAQGAWFFQNGPQRVYVELEAAPWVLRLSGPPAAPRVVTHTGRPVAVRQSALDEHGRLFLTTDAGPGLVHSQDMLLASDCIDAGTWTPDEVAHAALMSREGVCLGPAARALSSVSRG